MQQEGRGYCQRTQIVHSAQHLPIQAGGRSGWTPCQGHCATDCGAERSVIGISQARSYCDRSRTSLKLKLRPVRFRFADDIKPSVGVVEIFLPTSDGVLEFLVDIVDADVPLLIGLDILDAYNLVVNNVDNRLEQRTKAGFNHNSNVMWTIPLVRKRGHLFVEFDYVVSFTFAELKKLHRSFVHPSAEKLFQLIRRAQPANADTNTKRTIQEISDRCGTCQMFGKKPLSFKVSANIPNAGDQLTFNRQVDLDVLWIQGRPVLHIVDHETHFSSACFL